MSSESPYLQFAKNSFEDILSHFNNHEESKIFLNWVEEKIKNQPTFGYEKRKNDEIKYQKITASKNILSRNTSLCKDSFAVDVSQQESAFSESVWNSKKLLHSTPYTFHINGDANKGTSTINSLHMDSVLDDEAEEGEILEREEIDRAISRDTYLETINGGEHLENENENTNCTLVNDGVHEETRFMDLESIHVHPTQKSATNENLQLPGNEIVKRFQVKDALTNTSLHSHAFIAPPVPKVGQVRYEIQYNKCLFAEIKFDEKCKTSTPQDVIILSAESPTEIFVCPTNQIGLVEDLADQIRAYVAAVGDNHVGAAPVPNHLCIAKSEEDDQWYRAVCCKELGGDIYELLFVDYGNIEKVPRKHIMHMTHEIMQTPLLANRCILEGFENTTERDSDQKTSADEMTKLLPVFEETKIVVLKRLPNTSTYIVKIPSMDKSINPNLLIRNDKMSEKQNNPKGMGTNINAFPFTPVPEVGQVRYAIPIEENENPQNFQKSPTSDLKYDEKAHHPIEAKSIVPCWDPMEEEFLEGKNQVNAGKGFIRNEQYETSDGKRICKFFRSKGVCYRGDNCEYLHVFTGSDFHEKMGELLIVPANMEELPSLNAYTIIKVECINHPNSFFAHMPFGNLNLSRYQNPMQLNKCLQEIMKDKKNVLLDLQARMSRYYGSNKHNAGLEQASFAPGEIVAIKTENDQWRRARIVHTESHPDPFVPLISVQLVDYGNIEDVRITDVRKLVTEFLSLRFQAFECELADVMPKREKSWDTDTIELLRDAVGFKFLFAQVKHKLLNGVLSLDVFPTGSVESLSNLLIRKGVAAKCRYKGVESSRMPG